MLETMFARRLETLVSRDHINYDAVRSIKGNVVRIRRLREVIGYGEVSRGFIIILSGWAARYGVRRNGTRRITGIMLPGDFCGIHAMNNAPLDHGIVALSDCDVAFASRPELLALTSSEPIIEQALWRAKMIEEATLRRWLLNSGDAMQSVSHLLCEIHARSNMVGLVEDNRLDFPIDQASLADATGMTAVHLTESSASSSLQA